jgi:hypothetical protein
MHTRIYSDSLFKFNTSIQLEYKLRGFDGRPNPKGFHSGNRVYSGNQRNPATPPMK